MSGNGWVNCKETDSQTNPRFSAVAMVDKNETNNSSLSSEKEKTLQ